MGRAATLALLAALGLWLLHRLATWMESRGWIHYRRAGGTGVANAVGNAMSEIHAMVEPERARIVEIREEARRQDPAGEPPITIDAGRSEA
jgi:hypothetical protein